MWRQWKTPRRRRTALLELGVRERLANNTAGSGLGPWYLAKAKALLLGFPTPTSNRSVFASFCSRIVSVTSRTAVYGPVRTVVRQGSARNRCPYADLAGKRSISRGVGYYYRLGILERVVSYVAVASAVCGRSAAPIDEARFRASSWGADG
jgi:hypothetical protein